MKHFYTTILWLFVGITCLQAQTKITGKVIDASSKEAMPYVTVSVKGTNIGTNTDDNGNYQITVPNNSKLLLFSFVGYTPTEQDIDGRNVINVALQPEATSLDEVVVTAMGISREKKALAYAVQTIKADELIHAATPDLANAMQGKLSGISIRPSSGMPGASTQITIRGARSFTGDNSPLYIVDGMPITSSSDKSTGNSVSGTDFANRAIDIDPNDIESINVLKGQAASALYGMRAANGVILITTKSGKNARKGKVNVTFSSNVSIDKISRYPKVQTTYAQGSAEQYIYNSSLSWGPKITELPNDPTYGGNTQGHPDMYFVKQRENAGLDPWVRPAVYDNIKDFFKTGVTWNNFINVSQASDLGFYSISLGNSRQDGIVSKSGMRRYNAKVAAEANLAKNWRSGFSANFVTTSIDKLPSANDGIVATVYPAPPSYDLKGIPSHIAGNPYVINNYRSGTTFVQPYWGLENNKFPENTDRFFGNLYVNYFTDLAENHKLNVKYQIGADTYATHYANIWGYGNKGSTGSNGQIEHYSIANLAINSLLTATYDWDINDDLKFNALLGNEFNQNRFQQVYARAIGFQFPGWNHINNGITNSNSEEKWRDRTVGFFANASLSYRNMLFFNASGRNDILSDMPPKNRSFFYPSVSLAFILTELEGLKDNNILNFAKLRASYAQVGKGGGYRDNYYIVPTFGGGFFSTAPITYPIDGISGLVPSATVRDSNLKPQNTKSYEFGVDANFLNNIFRFSYTFSRQNVVDQIFSVPVATSTGSSYYLTNGGAVHTNSHEITLTVNPIQTKKVDWAFTFNWTKIDNYVDELAPGVESIMLGGFVTPQVRAAIGYTYPVIYGTTYLRDDNRNLIVNSKGLPQAGSNDVIGIVSPDFILGFNTSLTLFSKLNFAAVLEWKQGGQMYGGTNGLLDLYGISKETESRGSREYIVPGVKQDGSKNDIVIKGASGWQNYYSALNTINEASVYDNSFVKLREISLGYQVLNTQNLHLSINAFVRNILLWTNYPNFDPESSQGNNNMTGAFERFSLPQTSSFGMGVNIKF